jgi:vancomycin resistance protein VanW
MATILLSQRHPALYFIAIWIKRLQRYRQWYMGQQQFAASRSTQNLPYRIKKHQSVLLRKLGESDMILQHNKVVNLKIAIPTIDHILIKPGETFSFCKLVGLPSRQKGYLPGMELSRGEARPGIGGGLCQISNLLHWLVIHSPLTIVERHHHSFDPFPDQGRVLPFGSGATVFYNYLDFQFINQTPHTFQVNLWLSEKCLEGELRVSEELDHTYHVFEKNHQFLKIADRFYRQNEIWRNRIAKYTDGRIEATELLFSNFAAVKYTPESYLHSCPGQEPLDQITGEEPS